MHFVSKLGTIVDLSNYNINTAAPVLAAGLKEGLLVSTGNIDTAAAAPQFGIIRNGPVQGNVATNFPNQSTYVYTGQILVQNTNNDGTGTIGFAESFDDAVFLKIDGVTILNDGNYSNTTAGTDTLTAGWHNIEVRFGQGTGGVGPVADASDGFGPGFNNLGFGYNPDAVANLGSNGANYVAPVETGTSAATATLFRTVASGGGAITVDDGSTLIVGSINGAGVPTLNFGAGTSGAILSFGAHIGSTVTKHPRQPYRRCRSSADFRCACQQCCQRHWH